MAEPVYIKKILDGSTDGCPIQVSTSSSPGTTVHTAVSGTTKLHEIYLYITNCSGADVDATVEFGGTGSAYQTTLTVVNKTKRLFCPGDLLQNSKVVKVFATGTVVVSGWVHEITNPS